MDLLTLINEPWHGSREDWLKIIVGKYMDDGMKRWPDKWERKFGKIETDKNADFWVANIAGSGLTAKEIKHGLKAASELLWPPDINEFKLLCRPQIKPEIAIDEAIEIVRVRTLGGMGTWTHPAICAAALRLSYELRTMTREAVLGRWCAEFDKQMQRGEWPEVAKLEKPLLGLPPPSPKLLDTLPIEQKQAHLQKIKQLMQDMRFKSRALTDCKDI